MKKMNKKGFTLIEMLAVIAIIAVLVSIVIPVVGNATEKAKEAADVANIRSAIAEVTTTALAGETVTPKTVTMTQGVADFATAVESIGGLSANQLTAVEDVVTANGTTGTVIIGWLVDDVNTNGAITVTIGSDVIKYVPTT
jgi:prepilin-type N-terminal cleavage/methylation domain-containing protein